MEAQVTRDDSQRMLSGAGPTITGVAIAGQSLFASGLKLPHDQVTWPSPATTTRPFLRTEMMVVPCHASRLGSPMVL